MTVKADLDPQRISASRGLGESGRAQRVLAEDVRARCDRYVPYDTGRLRNTAQVSADGRTITYPQPYASAQFYRNYRHADPNRGAQWHRRMLAAERTELLRDLAAVLGGSVK